MERSDRRSCHWLPTIFSQMRLNNSHFQPCRYRLAAQGKPFLRSASENTEEVWMSVTNFSIALALLQIGRVRSLVHLLDCKTFQWVFKSRLRTNLERDSSTFQKSQKCRKSSRIDIPSCPAPIYRPEITPPSLTEPEGCCVCVSLPNVFSLRRGYLAFVPLPPSNH